jgi:23S rRNA (guanosine2251-2'-O)-methyltransferase
VRGAGRPGGPGSRRPPGGPGFKSLPHQPARPAAPAPALEADEELVAGRRPVEEAFAAGRTARRLLVTPQRRQALERIVLHATTLRIPIVEVEGGSLTALAGFDGHQGVAVVVEARRFASLDDVVARSIERAEPPFVLVLDSLEDPQNVGTLIRSAEAAGVHGVVFPTERQAPLTPAAIKASAGATEHLLLAPVDDLPGALTDLHLRGLRIVGTEAEAPLSAREADLRGPTAIVVGSEGHGLSPAVRRRCDLFVRIPMKGSIGSLNAAVAGSILLFEALGQRDPGARPTPS